MNAPSPVPLHPMRKIEIIVHAADQKLVTALLRENDVHGWSMLRDVAGLGGAGFHEGRTVFSDETGLVMFVAVARHGRIEKLARDVLELFRSCAGVLFLSDVEVLRSTYVDGD